jgi:pimeloyl-ACP methyl ester carboxylesterase
VEKIKVRDQEVEGSNPFAPTTPKVISGVGHLMYLQKPKEFADLVSRFVEQNE